ncbi:hypothetical protein Ddc_18178 [Ditylenchus destructor]|nr:hypothetical protein Ddc_18178 [Ditylenchus destructor]
MRSLLFELDESRWKFNEFFKSMKSASEEEKSISKFLALSKRHFDIVKKVQKADRIFKLFTLVMIGVWMPTTIFTPVALVQVWSGKWTIQMTFLMYDVARSIFHFYGLCIMPAQVHTMCRKTTILLNNEVCERVENLNQPQSITPLIKTFAESVTNTDSGITVGGMILIRKSMVLTCLSLVVPYVILFLQLKLKVLE